MIKTTLSNGNPVTADHKDIKENGQQKGYIVLSDEERAKGFVRPLRESYIHVGVQPRHPTRPLTDKEKKVHASANYELYEEYPESESPVVGKFWTKKQLNSGCGAVTTMNITIAETYARDPKFYGGTFCAGCQRHFDLAQFHWDGTKIIVGT